ncbi:MAG: hypothetical protein ABSD71_08540 [Bacteroidales bacterium]|jgi:hypothetical protein
MKNILLGIALLSLPFSIFAQQNNKPSDFHGIMTVDENKDIDFTSLNNPVDGTNIAYYKQKPGRDEYLNKEGRTLMPFSLLLKIEILPLTDSEAAELRSICGGETLQKARLTLVTDDKSIPQEVYLDVKWFEWRSDVMKGFPDTYKMEVRNVEEVVFKR